MRSKSKPAATRAKRQVFIVDDHPMMREGLARLIDNEPELTVCGEAGCALDALSAVPAAGPDLVLVDITLPDKNGLELIKDLQSLVPGLPVLVISMHDETLYAERVLRAGGRGYIMKQEGGKQLLQAIRQVLNGQIYVSQKISAQILESFSGRRLENNRSPIETLTDREFEIFQLIGQGLGTRQIAEQLHLSVKTIEVHRLHMKEKLGQTDAPSLVRYAVRWVETQQTD
jgi:DNA-binding NarL/FixJ family response regulator